MLIACFYCSYMDCFPVLGFLFQFIQHDAVTACAKFRLIFQIIDILLAINIRSCNLADFHCISASKWLYITSWSALTEILAHFLSHAIYAEKKPSVHFQYCPSHKRMSHTMYFCMFLCPKIVSQTKGGVFRQSDLFFTARHVAERDWEKKISEQVLGALAGISTSLCLQTESILQSAMCSQLK